MFYSKSTNGFYDPAINTEIPTDAVEFTADEHISLLNGQSSGKIISADAKGNPILIDPPIVPIEQTLAPLSQYQFRMCLINNNMLDKITTEINNIADATIKLKVETAFNYAQYFSRTDALVEYMISLLNLTNDQVNTIWQEALTI